VQRFGSPPVAGANRGALCDERLGESPVIGGGGDVQGRVAGVHVVTNRDKEVGAGILAARSGPKRMDGQARCLIKHSHDPGVVTGGDRSQEREQRTVVELVGSPACLRHGYRLPYLERGRSWAGPRHIDGWTCGLPTAGWSQDLRNQIERAVGRRPADLGLTTPSGADQRFLPFLTGPYRDEPGR